MRRFNNVEFVLSLCLGYGATLEVHSRAFS
jgi:hypothetical protein